MDEFIAFLSKYDSDFPSSIRGASPDLVERLTTLVGRALPSLYQEFLLRMGGSLGSLDIPNLVFEVDQIIEFYETRGWRPPPRYLLVAMEMQDPYFDYFLDLESPENSDFSVVRFESEGTAVLQGRTHPWFHSFRDMLFSFGFLTKRVKSLPHQLDLLASPTKKLATGQSQGQLVSAVETLALRMGFKRLSHASSFCLLLDRDDAAIYGHLPPRGGFAAKVAASESGQLLKVCELLRDHTSLA